MDWAKPNLRTGDNPSGLRVIVPRAHMRQSGITVVSIAESRGIGVGAGAAAGAANGVAEAVDAEVPALSVLLTRRSSPLYTKLLVAVLG